MRIRMILIIKCMIYHHWRSTVIFKHVQQQQFKFYIQSNINTRNNYIVQNDKLRENKPYSNLFAGVI